MKKTNENLVLEQIEKAKAAVLNKKCFFCIDSDSVMEFMNLGIDSSEEIWPLISELLDELKPEHHIKSDQRTLSSEAELATFIWDSYRLSKTVKLTFALHSDHFYYFSLS